MSQASMTQKQDEQESPRRRSGSWASGRTLTAAQRARKQAVDRHSHQQKAQQTQQYILQLEKQVRNNAPEELVSLEQSRMVVKTMSSERHKTISLERHNDPDDSSLAECCNAILSQIPFVSKSDISLDDRVNCDMIIRAVIKGWDAVPLRGNYCPLWAVLRYLDDLLFSSCSMIGRLVMLRMIHCMLFFHAQVTTLADLPPWYRPRPAQHRFRHEIVMGYFAWPGLRERLILSGETILTNDFFINFARSYKFYWPHATTDIYDIDRKTGLFQYSGMFENYTREIRFWQMDHQFFAKFPKLYDDMVYAEPVYYFHGDKAYRTPLLEPIAKEILEEERDAELLDQATLLHLALIKSLHIEPTTDEEKET